MSAVSTTTRAWPTWCVVLCVFCAVGRASPADGRFELYRTSFLIPERGTVSGYAVITSAHKITFLPPPDWTAEASRKNEEVILTNGDLGTSASFRFLRGAALTLLTNNLPSTGAAVDSEAAKADAATRKQHLRDYVQGRFPHARITHDFECFADGRAGTAFDLDHSTGKSATRYIRVAIVALPDELVEFQLTTTPSKADNAGFGFACLLSSFQMVPLKDTKPREAPAGTTR